MKTFTQDRPQTLGCCSGLTGGGRAGRKGQESHLRRPGWGWGLLGTGRGVPTEDREDGHGKGQQGTEGRTQERLPPRVSPRGAQRGGRTVTAELPSPLCSCGGGLSLEGRGGETPASPAWPHYGRRARAAGGDETGAGRRPSMEIAATKTGGGAAGKHLLSHSRGGCGSPEEPVEAERASSLPVNLGLSCRAQWGRGVRRGAGFCPVGGKEQGAAEPGTGGLQANGLSEHPAWSSLAGIGGPGPGRLGSSRSRSASGRSRVS